MHIRAFSGVLRPLAVSIALAFSGLALAADQVETTGTPGSPGATTTIDGKQLPAPDPTIRRRDQERCSQLEGLVGAAHRAAKAGAQHPADHHG